MSQSPPRKFELRQTHTISSKHNPRTPLSGNIRLLRGLICGSSVEIERQTTMCWSTILLFILELTTVTA